MGWSSSNPFSCMQVSVLVYGMAAKALTLQKTIIMKKFSAFLVAIIAITFSAHAQNKPYSIITCPGEDASRQMNISWAADTSQKADYVLYTIAKDVNWKSANKSSGESLLCRTFDSIYSKTADNQDFYEKIVFNKYGTVLKNLKPGTDYTYKIVSGNGIESGIYRFKTAGPNTWSAAIISDFHHYTPLPHRLEAAVAMLDTIKSYDPDIDWILHLGDVCAWGGSYSFWKTLYEQDYFAKYMWAGVNGNHDNMTRKYFLSNTFFRDANNYPSNGYTGESGVCYFFKYSNALFIILNNEDMHTDEQLNAAQDWVRKVAAENPSKYIIVCEHYQWFYGENGKFSQYSRWCNLFDELGVDLALAANNHIYVRTNALYNGKETDGTKGTVYVQTPSSDNERGMNADTLKYNPGIIKYRWTEGAKTVGGLSLKANNKTLTITLLNRYGQILDSVVVKAKR